MPELVRYANDKGVNVYGWDHWKNLDTPEKREKAFGLFKEYGIKGIKIDFLDSDDQERFAFRDAAIRDCLKYKLMLSFHGATLPRGQQRRWPHLLTWEAVHGSEWYISWSYTPNTPDHNCTLPFTRNVVGSMDYCPTTFSAWKKKNTNAHELALSVIFESGWQCLSDSPETYRASPGLPFLKEVPAAWDDIHLIDGYPGQFVCLARRKGDDWFVAGINAAEPRRIKLPLDFLEPGANEVKLYKDNTKGDALIAEDRTIDTAKGVTISLPSGGGFAFKVSQ